MRMRVARITVALAALVAAGLGRPAPAAAHCDSLDGPVVKAARAALDQADPAPILPWVRAADEAEVRQAFERALAVRSAAPAARDLADLWFFETVVRLHRAGEGEPYTGLKPAGWKPPEVIVAADGSLESGSADALAAQVSGAVATELRRRFAAALALRDFTAGDVEAGRRYVAAYVAYTHLLEAVHHAVHGGGDHAEHAGAGHR